MGFLDNRIGDYRNLLGIDSKQYPLLVEQAGTDYCRPEYYLQRMNSPLTVVGFTTEGQGKLVENGKEYVTSPGTIFLLRQRKDHHYFPAHNWTFSWFNVLGSYPDFLTSYGMNNDVIFHCPHLMEAFTEAVNHCVKAENGLVESQIFGQSFLLSLLPHLKYASLHRTEGMTDLESALKVELEKACFTDYDFTAICSGLGVTVRHAQRLFKQRYGYTPHGYVLHLRYQEACSLLMNPALSIQEIADRTGFSDAKYFSNFFRSKSGYSPQMYRKLIKK